MVAIYCSRNGPLWYSVIECSRRINKTSFETCASVEEGGQVRSTAAAEVDFCGDDDDDWNLEGAVFVDEEGGVCKKCCLPDVKDGCHAKKLNFSRSVAKEFPAGDR